jgi:hypothetical protein
MSKSYKTLAVLGSSSVALADPIVRDHRTHEAAPITITPAPVTTTTTVVQPVIVKEEMKPVVRGDVRIDLRASADLNRAPMGRPFRPLPVVYAPVTLANDLTLNGRAIIDVKSSTRKFTKLELRADSGRTAIDKVIVMFGNGGKQTIDLDAKLSKKSPTLTVDLAGGQRDIERIVLVGSTHGRGAALDVIAHERRDQEDRADRGLDHGRALARARRDEPAEEASQREHDVDGGLALDAHAAPQEHRTEGATSDEEVAEQHGRDRESPHEGTIPQPAA